ncbi:MAG: tRNA pseudouridine(55) synthase TruB [Clostridiales bacterium]|jgi:tRNA pseudouridine55 synthase|nr:tRNA pseudouridine(55) synthase TruB [Clostridiales bacterium]
MENISGVINIRKEKGFTSHDVVYIVRKTLGGVKTGHSGTLDPQAQGVLPILVGKATKISDFLGESKRYTAELILGKTTDTEDHTGKVLSVSNFQWDEEAIYKAAKSFEGDILQTPPMYSAVKAGGKKLYELARAGKTIERKARPASIFGIDILSLLPERSAAILDVSCSRGTYIRTLCADIGKKLGCGACMGELTRTKSGSFELKDSVGLDEFKRLFKEGRLGEILIPIQDALDLPKANLSIEAEKLARNGNCVSAGSASLLEGQIPDRILLMLGDEPAGIYDLKAGKEGEALFKPAAFFLSPSQGASHLGE